MNIDTEARCQALPSPDRTPHYSTGHTVHHLESRALDHLCARAYGRDIESALDHLYWAVEAPGCTLERNGMCVRYDDAVGEQWEVWRAA